MSVQQLLPMNVITFDCGNTIFQFIGFDQFINDLFQRLFI